LIVTENKIRGQRTGLRRQEIEGVLLRILYHRKKKFDAVLW
jgi:hypothetical protein